MPRRRRRMRAICGLVRKDAAPKAADRGPSAALCGKTLGPEAGCGAICGLVRKDAAPKRRNAGHLWPCAERRRAEAADHGPSLASGPVGPQATRHEVRQRVWWTLPRLQALDLSGARGAAR